MNDNEVDSAELTAEELSTQLARDIRDVTSRQMLSAAGLAAALVDLGWRKP